MQATAEAARRFLVARHFLAPARSVKGGKKGVLKVISKLGSIQFDPLAIAGRNHDLVLHARVADYQREWSDDLYERREIFEAYNKGMSFVRTSDLPWFRARAGQGAAQTLAENGDVAKRVLERVRTEGALSALDFDREHGPTKDWFGMPTNAVRAVLEAYAETGVLGLARREGNRRYYDLIDRLVPAELLAQKPALEDQLLHRMLSRYRAHGLLGPGGGNDIFGGLGAAKVDPRFPGSPGRHALRDALIDSGELVPVAVEGVGKRYVLKDEAADLDAAQEPAPSVAFLPPFDALVWDRPLLKKLFDFDYVWELFTPPAKRRWGWYVLPILFRDRFVGRMEPRIDRESARVEILNVWWEDGFAPARAEGFVEAMREALGAYLRFAGADRLDWASHLRVEKRAFRER